MANQLKDPADKLKPQKEKEAVKEAESTFNIANLKLSDLKVIPRSKARSPHPFEGYPQKYADIPGVKGKVNLTHLIVLNPKTYVHQDPSGVNVTHTIVRGAKKGEKGPKKGEEVIRTIPTTHNRVVVDYENGGINLDVDFGRKIQLADAEVWSTILPSHSARAQVCFWYDPESERIREDDRYLLVDEKQVSRLRRVFEMIINPRLKAERLSRWVTGESDEGEPEEE